MDVPTSRMCEMCLRRQFSYGETGRIPPSRREIQRLPTCALSPVSQRLRWITSHRRRLLLAEYGDFPDGDMYDEEMSSSQVNSNPDVLVIVGLVLGTIGALVTFIAVYVPFENPEIQPLVLGIGPSLLGTGILFCLLRLLFCKNLLNMSFCVWLKQLRPLRNAIGPSEDLYINWSNYRPTGWMGDDHSIARSTTTSAIPKKSCLRKPKEEQVDVENTNNNESNEVEEVKEIKEGQELKEDQNLTEDQPPQDEGAKT